MLAACPARGGTRRGSRPWRLHQRQPLRRSNFFTKFRDSLLLDLLQESLQVRRLVVEELNLFLTLLAFDFTTRCVARLDGFNLALELDDFVRLLLLFGFELVDALFKVGLAVLGLELLSHGESHGTTSK